MRQAILAACLFTASVAAAQQPAERRDQPATERQGARDDAAERFTERHGVSREELDRLQREEGMSWGDISHALSISERSKRPLSEILEHRRSGESWRDMSKRYELDYSQVRQGARHMEREARGAGFHDRQHKGRHERIEKGDERHQGDRDMMRDHDRMMDGHDRMMDERGTHERSRDRDDSRHR